MTVRIMAIRPRDLLTQRIDMLTIGIDGATLTSSPTVRTSFGASVARSWISTPAIDASSRLTSCYGSSKQRVWGYPSTVASTPQGRH